MKLILQNFRCFNKKTIDFPDKGVFLLTGESGTGKTTIFKAINFALYGKEQKVLKIGEKKYSVYLELNGLKITRTKSTHVVVEKGDDTYEDASAQAIINDIFGTDFLLTGYIAQKQVDGFFNLSDQEKTNFLNKLSIQRFDVNSLKMKVRDKIRTRKQKSIEYNSARDLLDKMCREKGINGEPITPKCNVSFPKTGENKSILDKIKEERLHQTQNLQKIVELEQELSSLKEIYENWVSLKAREDNIKHELDDIKKNLDNVINYKTEAVDVEIEIEKNKKLLKIEKQKLEDQKQFEILDRKNFEYETMIQNYLENNDSKLLDAKENLLKYTNYTQEDITKISNQIKIIEEQLRLEKEIKKWCINTETELDIDKDSISSFYSELQEELKEFNIDELKQRKEELESKITTLQNKSDSLNKQLNGKILTCPSCKIKVCYQHDSLLSYDKEHLTKEYEQLVGEINDNKKQLDKTNKNLKKQEQEYEYCLDDIKQVKLWLSRWNSIDISQYENLTKDYKEMISSDKIIKELNNIIEKCSIYNVNDEKHVIEASKEITKIKNHCKQLEKIDSSVQMNIISDIQSTINILTSKLNEIKNIINKEYDWKQEYKSLKNQLELIEKNTDSQNKINDLNSQLLERRKKAQKFDSRAEELRKYEIEIIAWEENKSLYNKYKEAQKEADLWLRALVTAEKFLEIVLSAEHSILESTINSINNELEVYMSSFFNDSMGMKLNTTKVMNSGERKSLIDIKITRNTEECPIDTLSGGEFDRCALALFLSFNSVSGSNLILLDECLSSLHAEAVEDIVDLLKTRLSEKLVIVTLHQANYGLFDNVINVKESHI